MAIPPYHPFQERLSRCSLLYLPTELRLQIFHQLLISSQSLTLHIYRGYMPTPSTRPPDHTLAASPSRFKSTLKTNLSPKPTKSLTTSLLYTCKDIYNEFLPLLYATVTVSPRDMFDAFLARLSPFATAHIHVVRLLMERFQHEPEGGVAWAIFCAQVKSLVGLKRTEVVYRWCDGSREIVVRNSIRELVGMKGVVFVGNADEQEAATLMRLFGEVERGVAAEREMRIEQMVSAKDMGVDPAQDGSEVRRDGCCAR